VNLYVVQDEVSSGIPEQPEVFTRKDHAEARYLELWRGKLHWLPDEQFEAAAKDDFWDVWPEDGGVRMWVVDVEGIELEPGPCSSCGGSVDAHQWHDDLTHTYGG